MTPPGLTPWSKVSIIDAGRHDAATAYAAINRIRCDDPKPHVYRTHDSGKTWYSQLYSAAVAQGDPDWLNFVNTTFDVAIFGHQTEIYEDALHSFFGMRLPERQPGLPPI